MATTTSSRVSDLVGAGELGFWGVALHPQDEDDLGSSAVQVVGQRGGARRIVAHLGSAHDELELAVLVAAARERIQAGQLALDLGMGGRAPSQIEAVVTSTASQVLWDALGTGYQRLGFATLGDEAFRALVLPGS